MVPIPLLQPIVPPEIEVYTAAVGGAPITSGTASVVYVSGGAVDLTNSTISATTPVVADGISTSIITVTLFDSTPVQLTAGGAAVFSNRNREFNDQFGNR